MYNGACNWCQILLRKLPFEDIVSYESWYDTIVVKNLRPQLPALLPFTIRTLIEQAWHTDPQKRPPASSLVTAFNQLNFTASVVANSGKVSIDRFLISLPHYSRFISRCGGIADDTGQ
jgi:hypothetical protein